jgi:hypothetical protein
MKSPSRTNEIGSERGSTNPSSSSSRSEASLRSSSSRSQMPYLHTCRVCPSPPESRNVIRHGVIENGPRCMFALRPTNNGRRRHRCHEQTTSKFQLKPSDINLSQNDHNC